MQDLLAGYLLNAVWQAPVVLLCALLVTRFSGLSPGARNGLWLGFLAAAAILPAVSLDAFLPHALPTVARIAPGAAMEAPLPLIAATDATPALQPAFQLPAWSVWAMAGLLAMVAAALIVRLVIAASAARRLANQSRPVILPAEVSQAVARLAQAHDRRVPPIRQSTEVSTPAVIGALRPMILIPDRMAASPEDLRAALLHEMAHVIRHDYAVNLACEVLTLPVSWHPALLGLKAGVRRSRESACDAMAAAAMASPKTYARCLVSLAQSLGAPAANGPRAPINAALAVGLFGRSDLEDRLMQLMKPKDTEAPVVRAARLAGLAAVGASLLGSAALLHVTPVFAQPVAAPAPVTAAPLAAPATAAMPAAASAASQAEHDAAKPRHHHTLIYSKGGVILDADPSGHRHTFKGSEGRDLTVYTDDAAEPTAEQERAWEREARDGEARAAAAEKMVHSPEFKARIAKAQASAAAAEKIVNSPEFKARIAKATADGAAAERMVNSPEFKARIAKAQERAAAAERMVNSPEFKDRIARANAEAAAAPERVRVALEHAQVEIQRQLDALPRPEAAPAPRPTP